MVRLTLIPALTKLIGDFNWSCPRWAERLPPYLSVEGVPEAELPLDAVAGTVGLGAKTGGTGYAPA